MNKREITKEDFNKLVLGKIILDCNDVVSTQWQVSFGSSQVAMEELKNNCLVICVEDVEKFHSSIDTAVDNRSFNDTLLSEFCQGSTIEIKVGLAFKVKVTVEGVLDLDGENVSYLVFKTLNGDLILAWIFTKSLHHYVSWIEIIK